MYGRNNNITRRLFNRQLGYCNRSIVTARVAQRLRSSLVRARRRLAALSRFQRSLRGSISRRFPRRRR